MKLHLDIDCTSLDDLKSAKATIDRLVAEVEDRKRIEREAAMKIARGGIEMSHLWPKEVVTDDATGEKFTVEPIKGYHQ